VSFFKNLFSKNKNAIPTLKQDEPDFKPAVAQINEPELEPIVVQAIENLYSNAADRKQATDFSIRYKRYQKADTLRLLLSLLAYSNRKIDKLLATEPDAIRSYQFMLDEISPRFPDLKAAEEWVKSITKPQA